jgi:hypothetical protein
MWRCTVCATDNQDVVFFCSRCACHRVVDTSRRESEPEPLRLSSPPVLGKEMCLWLPPIDPESRLVIIKTSRNGLLGLFAYTIMPLLIGLMFLLLSKPDVRQVALPVGIFFLLMAGLPGGYLLRCLLKRQVGVILDRDGILINTSPLSAGHVLWRDISKGEVVVRGRRAYIGLDVRDRSKYRVSRFNLLFNRYPFVITDWAIGEAMSGLWLYIRRILENPHLASELGLFNRRGRSEGPAGHETP